MTQTKNPRLTFAYCILLVIAIAWTSIANAQNTQPRAKCEALTATKEHCTRYAQPGKTTCWQHSLTTPICGAKTKKGIPCRVKVKSAGDKCWRHKG